MDRWHVRSPLAALVAMITVAAAFLAATPPATAQLYGPVPASADGDPTYDFTDQDSIWTYVRSDIAGGYICIVPGDTTVETGSCGAAGNRLIGIGTMYALVSGHGLPAGSYRLLVEDSVKQATEVSELFTVTVCPDCPRDPDAAIVAAWKAAAAAMSDGDGSMTRMCQLNGVLEKVAGKAVKARGIVELPESDDVSALTDGALTFVMTFAGGGFAMYNPVTVNIRKALDIQQAVACGAQQMYADQAADPPDPDFEAVATPVLRPFDHLGPAELDAVSTAVDRQRAVGVAMLHGYERYQGALAAGDTRAQVRQLRAAGGYAEEQATELQATADALRQWAALAGDDPELADVMVTGPERDELVAAYDRVRASGFTAAELDELRALGYTDPQIATIRSRFTPDIASVPPGTTYADALRQVADEMEAQVQPYRDMGLELLVVAGRIEQATANHAPVAADLAVDATPGRDVVVDLSATDADGDPLTYAITQGPSHGSLTGSGASRTYTAAADFTGTDTFTYTASDGEATSPPATVTITVAPRPNTAPTAGYVFVSVRQGESVATELRGADADGDPLTYAVSSPPQHGTLTGTAPQLTYTPDPGFSGADTFRYRVDDGLVASEEATVDIEVRPRIVLADDFMKADPHGVVDVLGNDDAPLGLVVTSATDGAHGRVTCGDLGGCTYHRTDPFEGRDSFTYSVRDEGGRTATATVQVDVTSPAVTAPTAPTAVDDRVATRAGSAVEVDVTANDVGSGPLSVAESTDALHGTVTCSGGSCRYTPDAGYVGYDGFGYVLDDGSGSTSQGEVEVTVAPAGARFDVTVAGRPAAPDGPGDTEVSQGESARWGASVTATPPLSEDEVAALTRPKGSAATTGAHALAPSTVTRARGWSTDVATGVSFDALAPALLGNRVTRPIPRPQPPISQGTGGDGHVPILVGTKVFAFFHHSSPTSVTCMDRGTGRLCPGYPRTVWQMGTTDINGPAAVVDGRIYTHLVSNPGGVRGSTPVALFCWDTRTDSTCGLEVLGRVGAGDNSTASAPVLAAGRIYLGAEDGQVYCFDPAVGRPCATRSTAHGLGSGTSTMMDVATHAGRLYISNGTGTVTCLLVPAMGRCAGWQSAKDLGGWNLLTQHDAGGAAVGVCALRGTEARCVRDDGVETTLSGVPSNDDYYGNTQEGETGSRTFIASLARGGLGCWDWSTAAPCAGAGFAADGWVSTDANGSPLPSAYGTTWDGSCLVALGDPGQVFTMDAAGNSPCSSLSTGTSSLAMDLRDQRCDGGVGAARWRDVSLLQTDPGGSELRSVVVRVVDAVSGAELLTGDLVGGSGTLSLAGIDPVAHPSVRVEAVAAARAGGEAWQDHVAPRIALTWDADPLQVCFTTTTVVDCAQPLLSAVAVRAALTGGTERQASLTLRRSSTCADPSPTPTPTPTPTPAPPTSADPDRDGDGLLNTQEATLGTDPDDPDTDGDGLGDGLEVAGVVVREAFEVCGAKAKRLITVRPSPLRADTDKDGISDGLEVQGYVIKQRVVISNKGASYVIGRTRTDPTRKDTDRDGLTDQQERTGSANKRWHRHKTDPSKCDTDHGALSDGIEVRHLSDPADFRSGPGDPGTIPMGQRTATTRFPV